MNKHFIFFACGTLIVILSVAVFNTGPIINSKFDENWGTLNCQNISDHYDQVKGEYKENTEELKKKKKEELDITKQKLNSCNRKKAMYDLEYSAFIIDVVAGFICSILGLLHYTESNNEIKAFAKKSGLIGLIFGAIGFVMTLVYLIYSVLVYTKDTDNVIKADENGVYANWNSANNVYICKFYKENDINSMKATFSEYGKKQYNYNKDSYITYEYSSDSERKRCSNDDYKKKCEDKNNFTLTSDPTYVNDGKRCENIYIEPKSDYKNKDLNDRWLTTIILSAIIILCTICIALFGFLIFKENGGEAQAS